MAIDESISFVTAQRLKALRNQKGLSHASLSKALEEKYGGGISVDSLKNYEVTTPGHTREKKNLRMSVWSLQILADFYGVSTDYILGRTDDFAQKPAAVDELGFSPEVIQWLMDFRRFSEPDKFGYAPDEGRLQTVNLLFENPRFQDLVTSLCDLIEGFEAESIYYSIPDEPNLSERVQEIAHSGKYRKTVSDLLQAQYSLSSDHGDVFLDMPRHHPFGINVTDILNNDVNVAVSRLVDSLRRKQE